MTIQVIFRSRHIILSREISTLETEVRYVLRTLPVRSASLRRSPLSTATYTGVFLWPRGTASKERVRVSRESRGPPAAGPHIALAERDVGFSLVLPYSL